MEKRFVANFKNHSILNNAEVGFEFEFYSRIDFYKMLEILNINFSPITFKISNRYHSNITTDKLVYKIEPDNSGGDDMVEIITHYMPYQEAKLILLKFISFLQKYGETNEKCSIQINISFNNKIDNKQIQNVNILKMILSLDEKQIWNYFPNRENSVYSKSIKRIIPYKQFDYSKFNYNQIKNQLNLPNSKYYGVNFTKMNKNYLEFRYMGGDDYQFKVVEILKLIDYFIITTWNCINEDLDSKELIELKSYLDYHIKHFKNFSKLDYFLNAFPKIDLRIDKNNDYETILTYYGQIWEKIHDLMLNVKGLEEGIINWDTNMNRLEVVNSTFEMIFPVPNVDFIDCKISNGELEKVSIIDSEIINCMLTDCDVLSTQIKDSKLVMTDIDKNTELKNCHYNGGRINGIMIGGVYRKGRLGPNAEISKSTKIVNTDENFFNPAKGMSFGGRDKDGLDKDGFSIDKK